MPDGATFAYDEGTPEGVQVRPTETVWQDTVNTYTLNIGTSEVRIVTTRQDKDWLNHAFSKFNWVASLQPNWDSYNAEPVEQRTLEHALQVYAKLMRNHYLLPDIGPTVDGGVSLGWHKGEEGLEIEIEAPFRVSGYYYNDDTNEEWEGDVGLELETFDQYLDRMSA